MGARIFVERCVEVTGPHITGLLDREADRSGLPWERAVERPVVGVDVAEVTEGRHKHGPRYFQWRWNRLRPVEQALSFAADCLVHHHP
jgi:hypothetical protein